MKRIGILTRDCAGINAAIRSVVRTADSLDVETIGFQRGYSGLIDGRFVTLDRRSVSGIINQGGTFLKTSRCKRFYKEEYQKKAVEQINNNKIDGLIVIGGNGSLTGAHILAEKHNIPVIGIPATIDNDVSGVDLTLGADTAVNVALDALDKIRDTATSLERIFVVEVMGRTCGYIALQIALAGGCEEVLVPEKDYNFSKMYEEIKKGNAIGKISWIIIVAEGKAKAEYVAEKITDKTGFETRVTVLGHIQRGGRPTAKDRILGARLGNHAVKKLNEGLTDRCVAIKNNEMTTVPLKKAILPKKSDPQSFYHLIKLLT